MVAAVRRLYVEGVAPTAEAVVVLLNRSGDAAVTTDRARAALEALVTTRELGRIQTAPFEAGRPLTWTTSYFPIGGLLDDGRSYTSVGGRRVEPACGSATRRRTGP